MGKKIEHNTDRDTYVDGWDIRTKSIPPISDDFYDSFVEDKVKGNKDYVVVDGLVALAHEKGYAGKKTEVIQTPNKENGMTTIVKVTVKGLWYNKYTKEVQVGEWDAIGDCSPTSAPNKFIAVHSIRMAETRALGRALRDYLNMAMLCEEEIGNIVEQPDMTAKQTGFIKKLLDTREVDTEEMEDYLTSIINRPKLGKNATEGEAQVLIDWLLIQPEIAEEDDDKLPSSEVEDEDNELDEIE